MTPPNGILNGLYPPTNAPITFFDTDFGDAPLSYGSASHRLSSAVGSAIPTLRLGATPEQVFEATKAVDGSTAASKALAAIDQGAASAGSALGALEAASNAAGGAVPPRRDDRRARGGGGCLPGGT